jgi:hypothetical protein
LKRTLIRSVTILARQIVGVDVASKASETYHAAGEYKHRCGEHE